MSAFNFLSLITRPKEDATSAAVREAEKKNADAPVGGRQGNQTMLNIADAPRETKHQREVKPAFVSASEFDKKLRWLVTNPPRDAEKWTITPMMARAMLAWNSRNRPISEGKVKEYASLMRDGRWHYTGESIIFSKERLLNGQHRLLGCVASGTSFDVMVVFDAPDDSFAFIDVGKTRTAANIFAIHGVKNHNVMAAATQWVVGYESERIASAARGNSLQDHASLHGHYLNHLGLQDSAWVASIFGKAKIVSPSMMVAIHYICAKKNKAEADQFFRQVGEGIGFASKKDPAYKLHKFFVDAAISDERVGRRTAAALTIKAWNAARRGRDVGAMRFAADEAFPRVI